MRHRGILLPSLEEVRKDAKRDANRHISDERNRFLGLHVIPVEAMPLKSVRIFGVSRKPIMTGLRCTKQPVYSHSEGKKIDAF